MDQVFIGSGYASSVDDEVRLLEQLMSATTSAASG
jgi:hypothetical protein